MATVSDRLRRWVLLRRVRGFQRFRQELLAIPRPTDEPHSPATTDEAGNTDFHQSHLARTALTRPVEEIRQGHSGTGQLESWP